jgi:16S rRNA (uracil1498-N3)-methyltransferase
MGQRYFVNSPVDSDHVTLSGPEAHHLIHVMRAGIGDQVILFDGSGCQFSAEIQRLEKSSADLLICERQTINLELPVQLTVATALPKGDRQKWLVEKLVELGTSCLIPLVTQRAVSKPVPQALSRLERSVVESSKQCGRNQLMEINEPLTVPELIEQASPDTLRIVAHPEPVSGAKSMDELLSSTSATETVLTIGPEGGWTEEEIGQLVSSQWQVVGLGPRVLRMETAAIALVARCVIQDQWM